MLADAAASGFNVFAGSWTGGSGPATVELVVLDWLRELCGLPEGGDGVLVSGGSVASLVALAAARERAPRDAVVYVSSEGHASIPRALRLLGMRYVVVPARDGPSPARRRRASGDGRAAARPSASWRRRAPPARAPCDPLEELADLGLWLHVDGAYGAPAALAGAVTGLHRADSLVLDPHKWLFQPYEIGCVLMREPGLLERTFSLSGVYLRDTMGEEVNFRDRSVQLTRTSRALKLWLSIRVFGVAAFREAIAHGIALAEHAEATLRARPGWEVVIAGPARHRLLRARGRRPDRAGRRHGRRRLRRPEHDGGRRARGAAPLHHQSAHDVRGRRAHDRAHGGAIRILRLS